MASLKPPFTAATAHQKVKAAQKLWNTTTPSEVVKAYTATSIWRNRSTFLRGHRDIEDFLTKKWAREQDYRLRKELFCFQGGGDDGGGGGGEGNKIAVQFWYEYRDAEDGMKWKRCYGIEHWTFDEGGKMAKRMMSGNDIEIGNEGRWFTDDVADVDKVDLSEKDF